MKLITGNSNLPLARAIAGHLGLSLADALVRRFADEEIFVEIGENVRGEDVFVIQSTGYPANDNLMELLIIIDALNEDGFELYSASTLVLLGDRARAEAASPPAEETVREIAEPLVASVRGRTPGATPFDAEVLLNAYGIAGATAVKAYLALPEPRDPDAGRALVRRAFEVLRDMR